MEKLIVGFGFGITCFFFLCAFALTTEFLWGMLAGLVITAFGWVFWDE